MRTTKRSLRWLLATVAVLAGLLALAPTVFAAEFIDGATIPEDTVIDDDVFIGGDTVVVDGVIKGDLFAMGSTVYINGDVSGSVVTSGQTLVISGKVGGSVYGAGAMLRLDDGASVGRNVYFGGFMLDLDKRSDVSRDVYVGGYQCIAAGTIGRDLKGGMGALQVDGTVGNDITVDVGSPSEGGTPPMFMGPGMPTALPLGIRVGDGASVGGRLTYTSEDNQDSSIMAKPMGGITHKLPKAQDGRTAVKETGWRRVAQVVGGWLVGRGRDLISLVIVGLLVMWLIPDKAELAADELRQKPWPSLGWGALTYFGGWIAAAIIAVAIVIVGIIVGAISLGGLRSAIFGIGFSALGLALAVFSLTVTWISKLVVGYLAGLWLMEQGSAEYSGKRIWPLLLGVVIYVILRGIPILGWLIGAAVTLFGLGATAQTTAGQMRRESAVEAEH